MFVACDQSPEVLQPADGALNLPSTTVATQFATVLGGCLLAVLAMRTDQIDAAMFSRIGNTERNVLDGWHSPEPKRSGLAMVC